MIGNAYGVKFEFPKKHEKQISVEEAIGDLPILGNGDSYNILPYRVSLEEASEYAQQMRKCSESATQNFVSKNNDLVIERYKHIKQGQNWRAIPDSLMENYTDKNVHTAVSTGVY